MVWVSMPLSESTTRMPSESKGYFPRCFSFHFSASGVNRTACSDASSPRGVQ